MYMYIVHVILNEPYTFNFTDSYSLKFSGQRTMKYSIAAIYTNEMLDLCDSRFNYMFKEIQESDYRALQCKKPDEFNFCSITNIYSLPLLTGYKYNPELKLWMLR